MVLQTYLWILPSLVAYVVVEQMLMLVFFVLVEKSWWQTLKGRWLAHHQGSPCSLSLEDRTKWLAIDCTWLIQCHGLDILKNSTHISPTNWITKWFTIVHPSSRGNPMVNNINSLYQADMIMWLLYTWCLPNDYILLKPLHPIYGSTWWRKGYMTAVSIYT